MRRKSDRRPVSYASGASLIAVDFLVLVLTWVKTHHHLRDAKQLNVPSSIAGCMLRDGELYHASFPSSLKSSPLTTTSGSRPSLRAGSL